MIILHNITYYIGNILTVQCTYTTLDKHKDNIKNGSNLVYQKGQ